MQHTPVLIIAGLIAASTAAGAGINISKLPPPASQQGVTYEQNIRPIFKASCVRCHSGAKPKGRLRLDSLADALKGGKIGKVILPGDSAHSKLVWAISRLNPKTAMPPKPHKGRGRREWEHRPENSPNEAHEAPAGGPPHKMLPPPKPLTAKQVGLIRAWIDQGAK